MNAPCFRLIRPVAFAALFLALAARNACAADSAAPVPLPRAHAHNDYWHERPLLDALERGFCSVEADVFLKDGVLLVGHEEKELRPQRTLEALYLAPLAERAKRNGGRVYRDGPAVFLLVDVKSEAGPAYAALHELLARYSDLVSTYEKRSFQEKAVTVVVSGNRDQDTLRRQETRYAGIDGRPSDLENEEPAHVMPWISANWTLEYRWRGDGPLPEAERTKLRDYVAKAHARGRLVRFWATPEKEAVWKELVAADVDLIGTDDLDRLQRFLLEKK